MAPSTVAADSTIHHNPLIFLVSLCASASSSAKLLIASYTSLLLCSNPCKLASSMNTSELESVDPALAPTTVSFDPPFALFQIIIGRFNILLPFKSVASIITLPLPCTFLLPMMTLLSPIVEKFILDERKNKESYNSLQYSL